MTKRHKAVLDYLHKSDKQLTSKEVALGVGVNAITVSRLLKELWEQEHVRRYPASGHQFKWEFRSYETVNLDTHIDIAKSLVMEMTIERIEVFLNKWSNESWQPKIFESARNLPYGLARLYELAVEMSYGAVIDREDLNDVRESFNEFRADLEQTLSIVNGLLLQEELWNSRELAIFLLTHDDVDYFKNKALNVKHNN